ncbi:MAG: LacI family DNA-binding transcriptional regulator [Eubacterium sp.]|nr:LacI family DNA-binding transcriptional regulator [Eubacterium sp.]
MSKLTQTMRKEGKRSVGDRRVIGLIVEDLFADYTREVIHSIYHAMPAGRDYRLVILVGKYDDNSYNDDNKHAYRAVCNSIYHLGGGSEIDGLIVSLGSLNYLGEEFLNSAVMKPFRDIPKVFVSTEMEGCVTVRYDNETGIQEAVDILVNIFSVKHLCMLGGREENPDCKERREVFARCLEKNGLSFPPEAYVETDMSVNCLSEAEQLLDQNPNAQAIFCVNDAVAKALYRAMEKRGLVPGTDIKVFGFDNTHMSGEMIPSLASVGSRDMTVGQRAMEILIDWMNGEPVTSELVPTMLYGRRSLEVESYDISVLELDQFTDDIIYHVFDECFYRYRNERYDRENVNLKRLFYEFISRILDSIRRRYMSREEFEELSRLADIFIDNGAMEYTDIRKFVMSIDRFQSFINRVGEDLMATSLITNRLFLRLRTKLIFALSKQKEKVSRKVSADRDRVQFFLTESTDYTGEGLDSFEEIIAGLEKLELANAALYLFEEPIEFKGMDKTEFPETICLKCVLKDGDLHMISKERQKGPVREMFIREDLPSRCRGYVVVPVFYGTIIYGALASEMSDDTFDRVEFIADQLGRAIHIQLAN